VRNRVVDDNSRPPGQFTRVYGGRAKFHHPQVSKWTCRPQSGAVRVTNQWTRRARGRRGVQERPFWWMDGKLAKKRSRFRGLIARSRETGALRPKGTPTPRINIVPPSISCLIPFTFKPQLCAPRGATLSSKLWTICAPSDAVS